MHTAIVIGLLCLVGAVSARHITKRETSGNETIFNVQMSGYTPTQDDDYVSVAIRAKPGYIVKFEPAAGAERIHHILLYGCTQPAFSSDFWKGGATCNGPSHILYAWARNAPSLELPEDVAFPIGNPGDAVQYLVMQVHYAHPFVGNVRDFSGIKLHLSPVKPKYVAQVYLFVSGEPIPPGLDASYNNMSCFYRGDPVLHPFAFRTHTHAMGRVVSAFVKSGDEWTQIGKRNPQWPQLFQKIEKPLEIKKNDFMSAICRFDSHDKTEAVPMGSMGSNEMCNFYMMFYRLADEPDPFPYGAMCGDNEASNVVAKEYPAEGLTLLPSHPEWEHAGHQAGAPFGVKDKLALHQLGDVTFGQISGMAFDSNDQLYIFHRGSKVWGAYTFDANNQLTDKTPVSENAIVVGNPNGDSIEFVKSFGADLFFIPHGIFVDDSGYVYTTDVGTHQVIKWKLSGSSLAAVLTLGERFVPGPDEGHFCKPAGVAVSRHDGSIFVADGYCNNRVLHFSKSGRLLHNWGTASTAASREVSRLTLGAFNLPHDISLDDEHERMYVADRENGRVQVFDYAGNALSAIGDSRFFGNVYSVDYCPGHGLFFVPGLPTSEETELNVYTVPLGSSNFQYAFRPTQAEFKRPHIVRARNQSIFVGEISDGGGLLWQFDMFEEAGRGKKAMHMGGAAMVSSESGSVNAGSSTQSTFVVILIVGLAVGMALLYYMRRHRVTVNSRTPHTLLDRAGFKPLRTDDLDDDDDSDDDLAIKASDLK
uniref:Peptidylglycine monooxygenase n=1 Tax=Panagrellus redivivus TaxID=6233 RepID=A0A7E4W9E0_PANRE